MYASKRRALDTTKRLGRLLDDLERTKSRVRAKVKHPFRVVKPQFGHMKVRYRGLMKNAQ